MATDFDAWMRDVDKWVGEYLIGFSVHDLPDCPFRDWFDSGMTAKGAACEAIRRAKG
ncbi:MAG: hypothetical protein ACYTAN_10395 [Planctomycetota bacterium]|jgi:hypothetical protein